MEHRQANLIQKEVGLMLKDVRLLAERTSKLQSHLNQADGDIKGILTSTNRVTDRAEKIERVELQQPDESAMARPELVRISGRG